MEKSLARPAGDVERVVHTYGNMLFRVCLITLGNASDAEDVIQETMITYLQKKSEFKDAEHEKAWLITVASNKCKDLLRFRARHPMIDLEQIQEFAAEDSDSGILEALMTLPEKFRCFLQDLFGKKCRTFWRILHLQIGENCRGTGRPFFTDRIPVQA